MSGPTPPGTGVIADATSTAEAKSTSPTMATVDEVDADVDDDRPGFSIAPVTRPGRPAATTTMSARATCAARSRRPRVADRHRRVLADEQEGGRHPDDRRPTDDDRVATGHRDPGAAQDLDRRVGRRRQEAVVAEPEETGVERVDPVDVLGRIDRVDDRSQPDRRRQRHLDDDAVDRRRPRSARGWPRVTAASVASPSSSTKPASMPTLAQPRRIRSR